MSKKFLRFLLIFFALFCLIFIDITVIEPNIIFTKTKKLEIPHWDSDLNGFKIALISDIHLGTKFVNIKKLRRITEKINVQNPDLIVICGDLDAKSISDANYSTEEIADVMKNFKAKHGVIAVMGNHDYVPQKIIKEIYKKANIPVLEHEDFFINQNKKTIRIVGFKDLWHFNSNPSQVIGTNYKTTPTVVLAHNPDSFAQMPDFVSLTLRGHTHGGEIVFPIAGSFFVPSNFGQRYRNGYIIENNKHLFVSRGIATLSCGRLLNPPEINILTLYSQTKIPNDTKTLTGIKTNFAPKFMRILKKHLLFLNRCLKNN